MNKQEAKQWIDNNFFGDLNEEEQKENLGFMVDKIYKDFDNRICLNCKYYTEGTKMTFQKCDLDIADDDNFLSHDFGCNKWEGKQ